MSDTSTIWVCQCCMLNHVKGECGCGAYYGIDPDHDPLSLVSNNNITMGRAYEEHSDTCQVNITGEWMNDMEECDCETKTSSTSQCEGCGSWLHGERHAMTLWL